MGELRRGGVGLFRFVGDFEVAVVAAPGDGEEALALPTPPPLGDDVFVVVVFFGVGDDIFLFLLKLSF